MRANDLNLLKTFLRAPTPDLIARFMGVPGAQKLPTGVGEPVVFIPGERPDRMLLVAHSDTVWDAPQPRPMPTHKGNLLFSPDPKQGIGADDRAGAFMLWMLRNSGHSILLSSDEELGCKGIKAALRYPKNLKLLEGHRCALQFDRRGGFDLAEYGDTTEEFEAYFEAAYPYYSFVAGSYTDITVICPQLRIPGVNVSVGYYHEHTPHELLDIGSLENTYLLAKDLLAAPIPKFKAPPLSYTAYEAYEADEHDYPHRGTTQTKGWSHDPSSRDPLDPWDSCDFEFFCGTCHEILDGKDVTYDDDHNAHCVHCGTVTRPL